MANEKNMRRVEIPVDVELPEELRKRVKGIERLLRASDCGNYQACQHELAAEWGMSVRSVQRLLKRWREEGIQGLMRQPHRDKGERQISSEWQRYILETWREGNRGGRRMTPAQVYIRVKMRSSDLELENHPSRSTVYRLLRPEIEKREKKEQIGSVGWRGKRLQLKTRNGLEIEVEHSNQVWQIDHTKVDVLIVDQSGEVLGRPWLTTVVDSYSRCIMGIHFGMESPSASVVCLGLRSAILPKQYGSSYELTNDWVSYGIPAYLYTDSGKEFMALRVIVRT